MFVDNFDDLLKAIKLNIHKIYITKDIEVKQDLKLTSNNVKIIGVINTNNSNKLPVLNFTNFNANGILITGNNYVLKNLIIQNSKDCGLRIKNNAFNNTVINCIFRYNQNSGLSITKGSYNNLIINCISYRNCDYNNFGKSADGFSCKLQAGPLNKFINCFSFENSDDGFDNYDNPNDVYYINCYAFDNGYPNFFFNDDFYINNFKGNGNGFKLGSIDISPYRYIKNCTAFNNKLKGFDQNNSSCTIDLLNNNSFDNLINYKLDNCTLQININNIENFNQSIVNYCNLIKFNCMNNFIY